MIRSKKSGLNSSKQGFVDGNLESDLCPIVKIPACVCPHRPVLYRRVSLRFVSERNLDLIKRRNNLRGSVGPLRGLTTQQTGPKEKTHRRSRYLPDGADASTKRASQINTNSCRSRQSRTWC